MKWILLVFLLCDASEAARTIETWEVKKEFGQGREKGIFRAEANDINCKKDQFLVFPRVIQSSQTVKMGKVVLWQNGNPDGSSFGSYYLTPIIPCGYIDEALTWEVNSPIQQFRRITRTPMVVSKPSLYTILNYQGVILFIVFIVISLFILTLLGFGVFKNETLSIMGVSIFSSAFLLAGSFSQIGIDLDAFWQQLMADGSLIVSSIFMTYSLWRMYLIPKIGLFIFLMLTAMALVGVLLSRDNQQMQDIMDGVFLALGCIFLLAFLSGIKTSVKMKEREYIISFMSVTAMVTSFMSDILSTLGITDFPMLFPIGILGFVILNASRLKIKIDNVFRERESLLQEKIETAEKHLQNEKKANHEIIRSFEKVNIGVAHEFNNILNGVATCNFGIKTNIQNLEKVSSLINISNDTVKRGKDIIDRITYSYRLSDKPEEVRVDKIVDSVFQILKGYTTERVSVFNKCTGVVVIPPSVLFLALINCIRNSVEADSTYVVVRSAGEGQNKEIEIEDNGKGIHSEIEVFNRIHVKNLKGLGIGLSVTRDSLLNIGWSIEVRSLKDPTIMVLKEDRKK